MEKKTDPEEANRELNFVIFGMGAFSRAVGFPNKEIETDEVCRAVRESLRSE